MENKDMSFNKRIMMVKKTTFEGVISSGELDSIAKSQKQGFYSLKTIFTHLYPALEEYNLDLDLEIMPDKIVGKWFDCLNDEKVRTIYVDFSDLIEKYKIIEKLPMMANMVQSDGAYKSYTRRYAYTSILGLNATDEIDTSPKPAKEQKQYKSDVPGQGTKLVTETKSEFRSINEREIKRLYACAYAAGLNDEEVKEKMNEKFNFDSSKDLNVNQFKYLCDLFDLMPRVIDKNDKKKIKDKMNLCGVTQTQIETYIKKPFRKILKTEIDKINKKLDKTIEKNNESDELPLTTPEHAQPAEPAK